MMILGIVAFRGEEDDTVLFPERLKIGVNE
uniref:Uncharacterized protein n=1 Tax=Lepeophtheirus salmonis TaxID=72036 RepID=A0A0K2V6R7_LEPSM